MQAIASILTYDVEMYVVNILQFCKISVKLTFLLKSYSNMRVSRKVLKCGYEE